MELGWQLDARVVQRDLPERLRPGDGVQPGMGTHRPEILAATCCHDGDPLERRAGSDGSPALDGIRIDLVGPDGEDVPTGEEGEICYWGPGAVLGYWRDLERTAATIDGQGRHHTGDLGRLDEQGYLRVSGRLKDIIIRGGTNISAAEVEGCIAAHPARRWRSCPTRTSGWARRRAPSSSRAPGSARPSRT
jgi:acyl-CoA synthetase (AMP-forming)/AMP-acid ligase II